MYEHFGPRPLYVQLLHQDPRVESFEECVAGHMAGEREPPHPHFDCLQTAGLQVRIGVRHRAEETPFVPESEISLWPNCIGAFPFFD